MLVWPAHNCDNVSQEADLVAPLEVLDTLVEIDTRALCDGLFALSIELVKGADQLFWRAKTSNHRLSITDHFGDALT